VVPGGERHCLNCGYAPLSPAAYASPAAAPASASAPASAPTPASSRAHPRAPSSCGYGCKNGCINGRGASCPVSGTMSGYAYAAE
jgi:hypothetical protein